LNTDQIEKEYKIYANELKLQTPPVYPEIDNSMMSNNNSPSINKILKRNQTLKTFRAA